MRVLFAVLVMGLVAMFATVLIAVQVVIALLPLIVAGLVVVAAVQLSNRRPRGPAALPPPPPWAPVEVRRPTAVRPIPPAPVGWVLVPVWHWPPPHTAGTRPLPVIDAEVISEYPGHA